MVFPGCSKQTFEHKKDADNWTLRISQSTLTDHLNTVRDIAKYDSQTDTTTVVNHLVYDAFGRVTSETSPAVDSLFLFTARPFDQDTQLQNNLNRWYDASVGRWLSEDPIGFAAGDGNLYRYVRNNPATELDPSGLVECNKQTVGARRGVATDTVFAPGNHNPDFVNGAMNFAIVISAISDIPIPGVWDIGDLRNKLNPYSPWGIEVAPQLAKLKNFQMLLRLNAGQASVWTKVQCQECKCTNRFTGFPFYRAQTNFAWVNSGKERWVQCDLSKTAWGQGENKKPASVAFVDSNVLFFELLELRDIEKLRQECAEQAERSCEK